MVARLTFPLDWRGCNVLGELGVDEVHVWAWVLEPLPVDLTAQLALLDEAERSRIERFRFADDQSRYALAHGNMRRILGGYLKQPAESIGFRFNRFGKPEIASGDPLPLSFNLSHGKTVALLAVVREGPVGVDVEEVRPIEPDVAASHFSAAELAELSQLQGDAWLQGFYRCWTRKEAILKAEGNGLQRALDGFDVSVSADSLPALRSTRVPFSHPWKLYDVSPAPGIAGALATWRSYPRILRHSLIG